MVHGLNRTNGTFHTLVREGDKKVNEKVNKKDNEKRA